MTRPILTMNFNSTAEWGDNKLSFPCFTLSAQEKLGKTRYATEEDWTQGRNEIWDSISVFLALDAVATARSTVAAWRRVARTVRSSAGTTRTTRSSSRAASTRARWRTSSGTTAPTLISCSAAAGTNGQVNWPRFGYRILAKRVQSETDDVKKKETL